MQTTQSHVFEGGGFTLLIATTVLLLVVAALWLRHTVQPKTTATTSTPHQHDVPSSSSSSSHNTNGVTTMAMGTMPPPSTTSTFEAQISSFIHRIVAHRREGGCDVGTLVKQKDRRGLCVGKAGAVVGIPTWDILLLMRHGERLDHAVPGWLSATGATYLGGIRGVTAVTPKFFKEARFAPTDPPLSPSGWSQALESAMFIRRQRTDPTSTTSSSPFLVLDAIHTSPFQRCVETALVVWMVGYECSIPLCVNPKGLSEFLSAKVTKQLQVGGKQQVLNGRWIGEANNSVSYALDLDTYLKPVCQWLLGALVDKPTHSGGGGKHHPTTPSSMSLICRHVECVLSGGGSTQVRVVEGGKGMCLVMPSTRDSVVVPTGNTLFETIGVNTPQEHKAHLHSRVRKGVFPEGVVGTDEGLGSKLRGAARNVVAPLIDQSRAAGVRHSITLQLPQPSTFSITSPPPTAILAVTHADVVSAALVELCADGASPTRLASGTSVPYASWTMLSRPVDACSLHEMAELSSSTTNHNNNNNTTAASSSHKEEEVVAVRRGMWRLGVPDVGHPPLRKHHTVPNSIPLMKYYPKALPSSLSNSSMEVMVGGGIGTTSHLDTIVKVVVDSR